MSSIDIEKQQTAEDDKSIQDLSPEELARHIALLEAEVEHLKADKRKEQGEPSYKDWKVWLFALVVVGIIGWSVYMLWLSDMGVQMNFIWEGFTK